MMILLSAALLPSAIWAQTKTPAEPNANAQPGQGSAKPGANLCGHVIDAGTFIDARARNASQEEAFVLRWLDPKGVAVHSGLFMGRCVARDGDTIDSKVIVRVLPNSLAVSARHALTAWEAEFFNYPGEQAGGGTPHRGVFNENGFVTELDPSKASEAGSPDTQTLRRVSSECLGHFWRVWLGQFWRAPKNGPLARQPPHVYHGPGRER
jgi:hypothetical protein